LPACASSRNGRPLSTGEKRALGKGGIKKKRPFTGEREKESSCRRPCLRKCQTPHRCPKVGKSIISSKKRDIPGDRIEAKGGDTWVGEGESKPNFSRWYSYPVTGLSPWEVRQGDTGLERRAGPASKSLQKKDTPEETFGEPRPTAGRGNGRKKFQQNRL